MIDRAEQVQDSGMGTYTDELLAELKAEGLIEWNGQFRRSPKTGQMQPVYVITEKGRREFEERTAHELGDERGR